MKRVAIEGNVALGRPKTIDFFWRARFYGGGTKDRRLFQDELLGTSAELRDELRELKELCN